MSLMSSSVWAGIKSKEEIYALKDVYDNKTTVKEELLKIGYIGDVECSYKTNPLKCHFEIHIEQGPVLEQLQKRIGIVTGGQAYDWITVTLKGKSQHTGTTPLKFRRDPLLAAFSIISSINGIAVCHGGLATVAKLGLKPNVANVIAEEVEIVIDIRHTEDETLLALIKKDVLDLIAKATSNGTGNSISVDYTVENFSQFAATHFNQKLVDIVNQSASAMIFVPSNDRVSHNPEEHTDANLLEDGFKVLLESVLRYDHERLYQS